jgi:hypothetical protein
LAFKIKSLFENFERIVLQPVFLFLSFLAQKDFQPHLLPLAPDTLAPSLGRPHHASPCASGRLHRTGPDVSRPPPPPFPSLNRRRLLLASPSVTGHHLESAPPPPSLHGRPPPRPYKRAQHPSHHLHKSFPSSSPPLLAWKVVPIELRPPPPPLFIVLPPHRPSVLGEAAKRFPDPSATSPHP